MDNQHVLVVTCPMPSKNMQIYHKIYLHCCFTSVLGQLPRTHMLVVITTILNHYDNMTVRHEGRREMLDTCFDIGHL